MFPSHILDAGVMDHTARSSSIPRILAHASKLDYLLCPQTMGSSQRGDVQHVTPIQRLALPIVLLVVLYNDCAWYRNIRAVFV